MDRLAFVEESWKLVTETLRAQGYSFEGSEKIRPLRDILMVRTDAPPQKFSGSNLYLSPKLTDFYGAMPKEVTTYATVMSIGRDTKTVKVGDRVAFTRIFFAMLADLPDLAKFGYVREEQLLWIVDDPD